MFELFLPCILGTTNRPNPSVRRQAPLQQWGLSGASTIASLPSSAHTVRHTGSPQPGTWEKDSCKRLKCQERFTGGCHFMQWFPSLSGSTNVPSCSCSQMLERRAGELPAKAKSLSLTISEGKLRKNVQKGPDFSHICIYRKLGPGK